MATCDNVEVDLSPVNLEVKISTSPGFELDLSPVYLNVTVSTPVTPVFEVEISPVYLDVAISTPPVSEPPVFEVDLSPLYVDVKNLTAPIFQVDVKQTDVTIDLTANPGAPGEDGVDGKDGVNAYTLSTGSFSVPPVGGTAIVPVQNNSWVVTGQFLYVDQAGGGPGQPAALQVVAQTPGQITLKNVSSSVVTGPGPSGSITWGEIPSGAIDGINRIFTTAYSYAAGKLGVYLNGIRQRRPNDYSETGSQTFQFLNAPLTGDSLSVDYTQP